MATTGSWYSDPATWAGIASLLGAVSSATKKGDIRFKQAPQTPEEIAAYNYAAQMAGVPNPDGSSRGTSMPSMRFVGPQISNMLQNYNTMFGDYKALDYLDPATGQTVARKEAPFKPFDFSSVALPTAQQAAPPAKAAGGPVANFNSMGDLGGGGGYVSGSEPGDSGRKQRLPNMAASPTGSPTDLMMSALTAFDPNMKGRQGYEDPIAGFWGNQGTTGGQQGDATAIADGVMGTLRDNGIIGSHGFDGSRFAQWVQSHPAILNGLKVVAGYFGGPVGAGAVQLGQWFINWYAGHNSQPKGSTAPPPATYNPTTPAGSLP